MSRKSQYNTNLAPKPHQRISLKTILIVGGMTGTLILASILATQSTAADPPACPFTCDAGEFLLAWNDTGWNGGTGWVDGETGGGADPNNALVTPQVYTNFDGMGNNITATFSGSTPSGGDPGPNIYQPGGNTFGCDGGLRLTGSYSATSIATMPTETIVFDNAIEMDRFYVGGMDQRSPDPDNNAEVSVLLFRNGGVAINPSTFTFTPFDAAHVAYQIDAATSQVFVYGLTDNTDGAMQIDLGGTLVDEIVWSVGIITGTGNAGTPADWGYGGVPSSQWITGFCYAPAPDPCDAAASGNTDTDGDNVSDICDLDDDNDGIPDATELDLSYILITPSDIGLSSIQTQENGTFDVSAILGVDPGSVIFNWTNAYVAATGTGFTVNTTQTSRFTLSGSQSAFVRIIHGGNLGGNSNLGGVGLFDGFISNDLVPYTLLTTLETGYLEQNYGGTYQVITDGTQDGNQANSFVWESGAPASDFSVNTNNTTALNSNFSIRLAVARDTDGDGIPDYLDIDSDNDGIVDNTEAQSTADYITPSGVDTDGDGLDDAYDIDCAPCGGITGVAIVPVNTGGSPAADYQDTDADGDGIPDVIEGHDTNGDGVVDGNDSPTANTGLSGGTTDVDGDGLLDGFDNNTLTFDATNGSLNPNSHPDFQGVTTERDWRENATLPVEWLSFDAILFQGDANITWSTAVELNSDYFQVERSTDGMMYEALSKINAAGTTLDQSDYRFTDPGIGSLGKQRIYYRIKQVDLNGTFDYSNVEQLRVDETGSELSLSVYPSPSTEYATLLMSHNGQVTVRVMNAAGQEVFSQKFNEPAVRQEIQIPVANWSPGVYVVQLADQQRQQRQRLVVR